MQEKRDKGLYVKLSQREMDLIDVRKNEIPIANRSAYVRKMAIDGIIIYHDISHLNDISRLLRITSNNVNQIAKRVNESNHIYKVDIHGINQNLTEIKMQFGQLLQELTRLQNLV